MSYSIKHHSRLNPKKESTFGRKKSILKKKANVDQQDLKYLDWLNKNVHGLTCLVCKSPNIEWHHVKRDSTCKKDHKRLIPLCYLHHRVSVEFSAHGTTKLFRETYPMDV